MLSLGICIMSVLITWMETAESRKNQGIMLKRNDENSSAFVKTSANGCFYVMETDKWKIIRPSHASFSVCSGNLLVFPDLTCSQNMFAIVFPLAI